MGSSLRGPARRGAADIDEGSLTEAVIKSYSREDGSKGQEMAEAVVPARQKLWEALTKIKPLELAKALRERAEADIPKKKKIPAKGGVHGLRLATADWLDAPPKCRKCGKTWSHTKCTAIPKFRSLESSQFSWRGTDISYSPPSKILKPRRRPSGICKVSTAKYQGYLEAPETNIDFVKALQACTFKGSYDVIVDRDAKILFSLSEGVPELSTLRKNLERTIDKAIRSNGRLILKVQLKYYSGCGSVTRADLLNGGGMGCRRALLDYDSSKAAFASYAINWIRQGMGEIFAAHETIKVAPDVTNRRRKFDSLGLDAEEMLSALDMAAFGHPEYLAQILEPFGKGRDLTAEISKIYLVGKSQKSGHSLIQEFVSEWTAKLIGQTWGGAAFLSSLRYGGQHHFSSPNEPDDEVQEFKSTVLISDSQEEAWMIEQDHAWNHQRFLAALSDAHLEDPEAIEVFRRYHGLEACDEEKYADISKRPLMSTGRKVSKETIRKLGERGQRAVELHLQTIDLPSPTDGVKKIQVAEPSHGPSVSVGGLKVSWPTQTTTQKSKKKSKDDIQDDAKSLDDYHELCERVSDIRW